MNTCETCRFRLNRKTDQSGISGTGIVAEGIMFPDGACVLWWKSSRSIATYPDAFTVARVHSHGGDTEIEWLGGHPARESEASGRVDQANSVPSGHECGGGQVRTGTDHDTKNARGDRPQEGAEPSPDPPRANATAGLPRVITIDTVGTYQLVHLSWVDPVPSGPPVTTATDAVAAPSADATAGPYRVEPVTMKGWAISATASDCEYYVGTQGEADGWQDRLNAAYRAGRDSTREPTGAMIKAGVDEYFAARARATRTSEDIRSIWDAMWKARDA